MKNPDEERDIFVSEFIYRTCMDGMCYELAVAVSRGTGLPMVGLIGDGTIRHAGVQLPNGLILDARGGITSEDFIRAFYTDPQTEVRPITEADLVAVRPLQDLAIHTITRLASGLWPTLPWKNSFNQRMEAFLADLHEVSRKHGMWVRGPVPAQPIHITEDDSGTAGYRWRRTDEGMGAIVEQHYDNPVTKPDNLRSPSP